MNQEVSRSRLAVVQLLVLTLLATLVARLWFLQVLDEEAKALAARTSVRLIQETAPRGFIFDRTGRAMARNRTALTVAIDVSRLPEERKDSVVPRLARVLDMEVAEVRDVVEDPHLGYYTPRPLALDVDKDTVIHLLEHQDEFPGVMAVEIPVREYPNGSLASHVIGHIGEINADELASRQPAAGDPFGYRPGDQIGKIGVESKYENWLRGRNGVQKIAVNVMGEPVQEIGHRLPERGWDAVLSIDASLQRAAEDGLDQGVRLARRLVDPDTGKLYEAPAGAVVALDPSNGEVLALASNPTFDPNVFVGPTDRKELARLNDPEAQFPMLNRAIAEAVPPGSTFKPVTALAAWDAGVTTPEHTYFCPGSYKVGNRVFKDWQPKGHGEVGLSRSLSESCDVVYYQLGETLNGMRKDIGEHLQRITRRFSFGRATGIDLLGERDGLVPDAAWKKERFEGRTAEERAWYDGDAANLSIGQGFLQVTPLQLASAYGAIANGGTVYRPHVLKCLAKLNVSRPVSADEACRGDRMLVPEPASPKVIERVPVAPGALEFMRRAMAGVTVGEGTAAEAFSGFPVDRVSVSGKTGTAQMKPRQPFSWFAAFAPVEDPQIVVVALVEEGGTGAQIAAPIVRRVLESHFGIPEGNFEAGARAD